MSLEQLVKKLAPTFLGVAPESIETSGDGLTLAKRCCVFLSASDMKSRAITRHAVADNPADAWTFAVDKLKSALNNVKPVILRVDWITSAESMLWADFLTSITKYRRNCYRRGLALDPELDIAFTEAEINGNSMLYRDGPSGDFHSVVNQERCNDYCQIRFGQAFPTPEPSSTVITFTTNGAFASDDEKSALLLATDEQAVGHRLASAVDDDLILKLARSGATFIAKDITKNPRGLCDRYPCVDKTVPNRMAIKHFNYIRALLEVCSTYGRIGNNTIGSAITKAIQVGIKNYVKYNPNDPDTAYIVETESSSIKLGAVGSALIALARHSTLMKTKKHLPLMNALANGIISMQNDDGSFNHALNTADFTPNDQIQVVGYDGQATVGLLKLYGLTKDARLLDAALLAFNRFLIDELWKKHDPWFAHAVDEITLLEPRAEYFEFGINNFLEYMPTIYRQTTHDTKALELFTASYSFLERMRSIPEMSGLLSKVNAEDFAVVLEQQASNIVDAFFFPEYAMHFKRPEGVVGAFFLRHDGYRVLILDGEFWLTGAVAYRQYLARRDHAPQASKELTEGMTASDAQLAEIRRREAVSELMSPLDQLARRLKAAFLDSASKNEFKPCRVFLSASSMHSRAVTRHASAFEPLKAWNAALEMLRSALGTIEPVILRADWIIEAEPITWADFNNRIGQVKRNYYRRGLALDENFALAFTECEINANVMLYRGGPEGSNTCAFNREMSNDYCRRRYKCDFPSLDASSIVYTFSTNGVFVSTDLDEPLHITDTKLAADHRDVSHTDDALILSCARSGAMHLAREIQPNGRFVYGHFPCIDKTLNSYSTPRHFSSLFAMLDVYSTYTRPTEESEFMRQAIDRAIEYGIKQFVVRRQLPDGSTAAYVDEPVANELKLGCLSLTLLALTRHSILMKTDKYLTLMNEIANGIMSMQQPDGSFVHVLNTTDFSLKAAFRIVFFDGEAVFAMMRLYAITRDERLREASERAFNHFVATDHWQHHDHWLSYAVNEFTQYQPRREYFEFGINNVLSILPYVYQRFTAVPTVMEMMMAADTMLERMKTMPEMSDLLARMPLEDFYAALESRAKKQLNGFFWPELAMFFKRPESIVGSFYIRHDAFRVRIDDIQHFLGGLVNYRRYLARRDHDPIPSEALLHGKVINPEVRSLDLIRQEFKTSPNAAPPPPKFKSMPGDFDASNFLETYKARNCSTFIMLRHVKPAASGLENSAFRRAKLFRAQLGFDAYLITNEYQNDIGEQCEAYGLDFPVLNIYDYYQGIDRSKERRREAVVEPESPEWTINRLERDWKVTRPDGSLAMYCVFSLKDNRLNFINFFDENGKKCRRDTYDELGFLSRRQKINPESGRVTEADFYRTDGTIAVHEVYRLENEKTILQSMDLVAVDGTVTHTFDSRDKAIAQWLLEEVSDRSRTYFLIGDRTPEYHRGYEAIKRLGLENVHVLHQLHNLHVLEPYDPFTSNTKARYRYLYDANLKSDVILALTARQGRDIVQRYKLDNAVVLPHALPSAKRLNDVEVDPFKIVQVGRIAPEKGQEKAVEMMKSVLEQVPQATLHFYGRGPLQKQIQATIDEAGLSDRIVFEGYCTDMAAVYASAALSILPSTNEGSPLVVQESMQQGCPVVAFNCNYGPDDVIEDDVSGYIVPVGDVDEMADRVIRILTDEELRERLSGACAKSLEKFAPEFVARQWAWLMTNLL